MLSDIHILTFPLVSFGHCVVWYTDSDYPLVSFGHCVVWYTDSDCHFGIFWSLCCLIYRFWLPLWYLLAIVLSDIQVLIVPLVSFGHCVVWYTDSYCPFGIFWSLYCLIYRFWLPLWYLLVIVLSDIQILIGPLVSFGHCVVWYTYSDCPFGIFWSLCCLIYIFWLSLWYPLVIVLSDIQILITPLVSFGHCVVWYTDSDCPFGIFWSLCCLIYRFWLALWYLLVIVLSDIQIMITPLVSFGDCVVWYTYSDCPFGIFWSLRCLIYGFWLSLWYLLVIVLSDIQILIGPLVSFGHCIVWYTDSDCPFGIFWSLCCLIYGLWLPFWCLLAIVLSDIQTLISPLVYFGHCVVWYTDSAYPFGIFWSLCCLIYRFWLPLWYLLVIVLSDIQILISPLVSFGHCVVWYTDSDCPFGIFWSLCCPIYRFWLSLWYLLVIVLSDIQILIIPLVSFGHCVVWYTDSDYPFGIFWSFCCLINGFWLSLWYLLVIVLSDIQILIAPLVSFGHCVSDIQILISPLVYFGHCVVWYTDSDCPFGIFWSLCCLIYRFWLPLWYLLAIVLSDIQILITPLVSFGHCVVWYTDYDYPFGIFWSLCCLIYRFWLPLWYLLVIVLSDIQILIAPLVSFGHCVVWYTDSDFPFGIFWSLCCLIYRFWLPLWYLLVIVLSDIQILIIPLVSFGHCVVWYTDSDCPFGIFWSLCCLIFRFWLSLWYLLVIVLSDIQILIIPLVSFGHCVVWYTDSDCPFGIFWSLCCLIYRFWLPLWYLLVIVLSDIQILIIPLVSFGHCVVWYSDSDCPFWYPLVIVLSDIHILIVPLVSFGHCVVWYTDSDYPFGIFWSLCCLIYRFWLPLWYLLVIVLSDMQILISPLFFFWSLCCLIYRFWLALWYFLVIVLSR